VMGVSVADPDFLHHLAAYCGLDAARLIEEAGLLSKGPDGFRGLTDSERCAVWLYTGWNGLAQALNSDRHSETPSLQLDLQAFQRFEAELTGALRKLPSFQGVVYRGIRLPGSIDPRALYNVGSTIVRRRFISAARTVERAFAGNVLFAIASISGRSLQGYAQDDGEEEILFMLDTAFVVESVMERDGVAVVRLGEIAL
jgi:NAD:arginine ADP-ribosyltransferase